eukprot:gene4398-4986_t
MALDSVAERCPVFHQYLKNTYQAPTKLYISGSKTGEFIWGEEGNTQGDVAAMPFYGLATMPIIDDLQTNCDTAQAWYADDSSAADTFTSLLDWWIRLNDIGPKYVTSEGQRHLGAVFGSTAFKKSYVESKVKKWTDDIEELADIAEEEPQLAYAVFTKGICHRWTYFMRTIPDISELLIPLKQKISERFLPALLGRKITDNQREILELPVRYGGLGIINPARMSQREYDCSRKITEPLVKLICEQNSGLESLDQGSITGAVHHLKKEKEELLKQRYEQIYERCDLSLQRHLEQAKEPGASSWLTALPLKSLNYILNKREFQDSVCLRYGWTIKDMPTYCGCGERNSVNNSLDCKAGGYVNMRHNAIRDSLSYFLKEAKCKDVRTEPSLLPVQATRFSRSTNVQDEARLDISAVGIYAPFERTFFDVRVTHPNCETNSYKHLDTIYKENEREKKNKYEERVLQSEKGTFVPLIFTTSALILDLWRLFRLIRRVNRVRRIRIRRTSPPAPPPPCAERRRRSWDPSPRRDCPSKKR